MVASASFKGLVEATQADRKRVRRLVAEGRWREAEPDKARLAANVGRTKSFIAERGAEAIQGDTNDFQPVSFLGVGARVQRAVGYVEVVAAGVATAGSGFLISPDLFLTNAHVIENIDSARGAQIVFDRQIGDSGRPLATTSFLLDPDRFALFSPEDELDYALVAIGERLSGTAELSALGYCPLSNRPDKHRLGMAVNIVQHPVGAPKLIAIRNNVLTHRTPRTLLYETDTDYGASGSPVFNDLWEVIALHHWGGPFLETTDDAGEAIPQTVNEGVRISAIYNHLEALAPGLPPGAARLLATALGYDKEAPTTSGDRTLGPPRPSRVGSEAAILGEAPMQSRDDGQEIKVVIPIEVTVRVGGGGASASAGATLVQPGAGRLVSAAEKLRIDKDYSNRSGYSESFIPGVVIPLPKPDETLAKQIAPLRPGEPDADKGLLKYEHFSIVLNKAKRIAMFSATNIDGKTYLDIDRDTGRVKAAAEGETWYLDPRVSQSFYLDQTFYSAWSTYFDRGHLTRRMDPNWGTPEVAERANADTYHFPNCSPQHFRFNQTTKYWQGLERYVLEDGALDNDSEARLCVFQGPIFADATDRFADDVQIPSSFFKVVVWKHDGRLKAVGLVADQFALLDEKRGGGLGQGNTTAAVNVNQWRVAIKAIEKRTGLDFGDAVRAADTIATSAQPTVGEAQVLITGFGDIKLA